ncbi:MAG: DUF1553 domain-containing protein [Planctomycetes bacterium]|nr:DUF1553 domain-containing protein [Planctomycetota bacterium]
MRYSSRLFALGLSAVCGCFCLVAYGFSPARADETAAKEDRKTEAAPTENSEAALTAAIDREIAKVWERDGVTPAGASSDEEFLRRVCMDTVGIPPTPEQAAEFLDDKSPDKRAKLIDQLVDNSHFGEHLADLWLNILTGRTKVKDSADAVLGIWLAEQFNSGRGFDQVMYDIITAQGKMSDNPAAAYYGGKRELKTPDIAGEATRQFTGVQIQCAQCHDHPYEDAWKVAEFNGVASFFAGTKLRRNGKVRPSQGEVTDNRVQQVDLEALQEKLKNVPEARREEALEAARYSQPKYLLGDTLKVRDARLWRKAWAGWVISAENNQTRSYIANRFWSFLFGMGILNPVDDFNSFNEPSHPELLQLLADDIGEHGYDIKRFYRAVLKSRTYHLSSADTARKAEAWHFASHPVRQLTPEQFFAALISVNATAERQRNIGNDRNPYTKELQQAKSYQKREAAGKLGEKEKKYEYDLEAIEKLRDQVEKMSDDWALRRAAAKGYTRSSDDDEETEADGFSLTIDQALLVMNGQATTLLSDWSKGSVLDTAVSKFDTDPKRLERLYLVVLNRRPDDSELKRSTDYLKSAKSKEDAWEDILFTLLVSTEFATTR